MCSEKQTQIGRASLNLWEPRWTLTTKISKSFELSAKVPGGSQPASVCRTEDHPGCYFCGAPGRGTGWGWRRQWEAQEEVGRGEE